MKQFLYSIKDSAVGEFAAPFMLPTAAAANRAFFAEVRNPESMLHKHPSDYELHCLGILDTETGDIYRDDGYPRLITRAVDVPPQ